MLPALVADRIDAARHALAEPVIGVGRQEMAVAVETRSASVSVARFENPKPSRTIGMIWRRTSPLANQLLQISEVVRRSAAALREQQKPQGKSMASPRRA